MSEFLVKLITIVGLIASVITIGDFCSKVFKRKEVSKKKLETRITESSEPVDLKKNHSDSIKVNHFSIPSDLRRIVATLIDLTIVHLLIFPAMLYDFHWKLTFIYSMITIGFLYLLFKDAIFNGQSIGKKIIGLRVVNIKMRKIGSSKDSVIRNFLLATPFLFAFTAATPIIVIIYLLELLVLITHQNGMRVGDQIAGTLVIESRNSFSSRRIN